MVIKHKNVTYGPDRTVCFRQAACSLYDKELPGDVGPLARKRYGIELAPFVRLPDEVGWGRRWPLPKVIPIHDSHPTAAIAAAATTRARDLCVTLKVSVALLLLVERRARISQEPNWLFKLEVRR
jgi:hypothetical protein